MKKYIAFFLLDIKSLRRLWLFFEMVFWPLLGVSSFGLFTIFTNASTFVRMFLFTGVIGWSMIQISQHAIGRGFMVELWRRSIKHTFTAPVTIRDFIIGHWMYGVIAATMGFLVTTTIAFVFFGFNLFALGIYIPLVIGLATLCGLIIGMISISAVMTFGLRVDFIVWTIVDLVVFISGVYYAITVFPEPVQTISRFFPAIYLFEGVRTILLGGSPQTLLIGYGVALIWIVMFFTMMKKIENYAKRTGFYQRYG